PRDWSSDVCSSDLKTTDLARAGTFELTRVAAIDGTAVTLTSPLVKSFESGAQLIVVPEYTFLTVAGTVVPLPFDGSSGGIVAFLVQHTLTIDGGTIVASEAGFRGGVAVDDSTGAGGCV